MPQLRMLGGGKEVGRSCIRLDINNHHFLMDCGVDPASTGVKALPDFSGTSVDNLDAIFVSHAHLDHTGGIPELVRRGFRGKVFMTLPTLALVKLLWQDELSIMEREWPKEERLWSSKEMHQILNKLAVPTTYHEVFKLDSLSVNFHNAGHILGSTMTEVSYKDFRVVYSGDLGSSSNHLRYWRTEDIMYPDVLICEGTYGGKNRKSREEISKEFVEAARSALESGGSVLIPTFSVGKAQELLKILKDSWNKIPNVDVYLEGMALETLRIYEQFLIYMDDKVRRAYLFNNINPFRWDSLKSFRSLAERRRLHERGDPCIILSPSGMLRGGWSVWHMIRMAQKKENLIALCGHMEEGTTGHLLTTGARHFVLKDMISQEPKEIDVRCNVTHFEISSHAMHNELCNFISRMKPERLVLVHGDEQSLMALADSVRQHAGEVLIPAVGETVDLGHRNISNGKEIHVEVPISQSTSIIIPKGCSLRIRHRGKEKFMRAEDIRSLLNLRQES
ncbi:MAG: MBL fold metallo-hydrolase RNA specificity domain-containing protein [Candidatus Verstraetearchaeota archaeon]|nr:MBL fold metallo-hydrolase RNA specificity domain-containing protein [Candidatus Verstraetearchaeota archaeon]